MKRKRGRPRKNENSVGIFVEEPWKVNLIGNDNFEGNALAIVNNKGFEGKVPAVVNEKVVESKAEAKVTVKEKEKGSASEVVPVVDEDPIGEELKRRTQGLETETQMLEFLETLNGEWASQRKKRRIVPASDLGDLLPAGWKIVITLVRRAGRASAVCRRYSWWTAV